MVLHLNESESMKELYERKEYNERKIPRSDPCAISSILDQLIAIGKAIDVTEDEIKILRKKFTSVMIFKDILEIYNLMFSIEDFESFPWEIVEKVVFSEMKMTITFKTGNGIEAKPPDKDTYEEFQSECLKNLRFDQVLVIK